MMRVRDVMTADVVTATLETPLARVIDDLIVHGVSGMPVIDEARHVVGVISEADVLAKEAYGPRHRAFGILARLLPAHRNRRATKARGVYARDVMTEPATTARPDDPLPEATARMVTRSIKRLPVVDNSGTLVGIVSRRDVIRLFHRTDVDLILDVNHMLADPLATPEDANVSFDVHDGKVFLAGSVRCPMDARLIEAAVLEIPGVLDASSEIVAREPNPRLPEPHPST